MTQPVPTNVVSLSDATAVLLADGEWVTLMPGSPLTTAIQPTFIDSQTGQQVAPGENWFQFQSTASVVYACPASKVMGVQLAAPVVE